MVQTAHVSPDLHNLRCLNPLGHSSPLWWFWGPSEAGQRDPYVPPSLFLNGSISLKKAPPPPQALLHEFFLGVHTPELSTAFRPLMSVLPQLLTQRAGPLSKTQSSYCPSSTEALATHNIEQLTNWEQPCRFLSFVFACGETLLCIWKCIWKNTRTSMFMFGEPKEGHFFSKTMMYFTFGCKMLCWRLFFFFFFFR